MTTRMTTAEVLEALDHITPETMALAQASLRRDTGRRAAAADSAAASPITKQPADCSEDEVHP